MNRTPLGRRTQIIHSLVEGNSIRSTERLTDTHRDTITRLMDERMRDVQSRRIQVDEIWTYVQKKQRHVTREDDTRRVGDQWIFVALDPDTKLVPAYLVGKRRRYDAVTFMADLSERLANRVQLSSDALRTYVDAVERAFGADVDYGQAVKFYEAEPIGPGRYSPPRVMSQEKTLIAGSPDHAHISTSLVERQNLTMRMSMRRLTRLTNAFSKKIENLRAATSLHFAYYNFARVHKTLRTSPAMAAGIENRLWSLEELVERTSR
ncbi:MAG TPA: IS1 family transposase [Stellaceae bacterium]|nr:IS1 family transposase [Stellaceae bacterium]